MTRYVVRHAKAGQRRDWAGDDRDRPLSKTGRAQAAAIAERLADVGVTELYASPFARCVQTLEPLAARVGAAVIGDERLAEGAAFKDTLALLAEAGDGAVLCSHGDVIPELIAALARRGAVVTTDADWRKASIWVLDGDSDTITSAAAEPPPRV